MAESAESAVANTDKGPTIALQGVSKRYQLGGTTVTALADVNLSVTPGEFVVILGPSGCGKTTLLNLLGALDTSTEGRVLLGDADVGRASNRERFAIRRHSVSFVFQSFNLFGGLTALENVRFGADVARRRPTNGRQRGPGRGPAEILEQVGLGERLSHFPHELSGGEQQRVAIARALATGNPILLADEPTGELDFHTGIQILQLLHDEAEAGTTVLIVTHNREIARISHRIIELSSGRIRRDGPPPGGPADVADLRW
ncbi:MAG: ABC transporter ATP-binding protein [Acidimicrobiales bacterium]